MVKDSVNCYVTITERKVKDGVAVKTNKGFTVKGAALEEVLRTSLKAFKGKAKLR